MQKKKFLILVGLLKKQIIMLKLAIISSLAPSSALTAVDNKISNVNNLVKTTASKFINKNCV